MYPCFVSFQWTPQKGSPFVLFCSLHPSKHVYSYTQCLFARCLSSPVYPRTLDAHGDSEVDGGPTRFLFPTVAAQVVARAPEGHIQRRGPLSCGGTRRRLSTSGGRRELSGLEAVRKHEDQPLSGPWLRTLRMDITDSEQSKNRHHHHPVCNIYVNIRSQTLV